MYTSLFSLGYDILLITIPYITFSAACANFCKVMTIYKIHSTKLKLVLVYAFQVII